MKEIGGGGGGGGGVNHHSSAWKHTNLTFQPLFSGLCCMYMYFNSFWGRKKYAIETEIGGLTQEAKEKVYANFLAFLRGFLQGEPVFGWIFFFGIFTNCVPILTKFY